MGFIPSDSLHAGKCLLYIQFDTFDMTLTGQVKHMSTELRCNNQQEKHTMIDSEP